MAISYSLELATPSSAEQVDRELHDLGANVADQQGVRVTVTASRPQPWNPVITDLGFTPTVSVSFRLDKMGDIPDQQDDMIRLVSGLLDRVTGDAVLHREFEDIWLLRRDGVLTVNERADIWPPQRLAALSQPHRRLSHAFSEQ